MKDLGKKYKWENIININGIKEKKIKIHLKLDKLQNYSV